VVEESGFFYVLAEKTDSEIIGFRNEQNEVLLHLDFRTGHEEEIKCDLRMFLEDH
jgi:hypothetical protein